MKHSIALSLLFFLIAAGLALYTIHVVKERVEAIEISLSKKAVADSILWQQQIGIDRQLIGAWMFAPRDSMGGGVSKRPILVKDRGDAVVFQLNVEVYTMEVLGHRFPGLWLKGNVIKAVFSLISLVFRIGFTKIDLCDAKRYQEAAYVLRDIERYGSE